MKLFFNHELQVTNEGSTILNKIKLFLKIIITISGEWKRWPCPQNKWTAIQNYLTESSSPSFCKLNFFDIYFERLIHRSKWSDFWIVTFNWHRLFGEDFSLNINGILWNIGFSFLYGDLLYTEIYNIGYFCFNKIFISSH